MTIEIPKGRNNKYRPDPSTGRSRLERELHTAMAYPADFGLIEGPLTERNDHLNAFVLLRNAIVPGTEGWTETDPSQQSGSLTDSKQRKATAVGLTVTNLGLTDNSPYLTTIRVALR